MATITAPDAIVDETRDLRDEPRYEVIGGRLREKESMGTYPTEVATILAGALDHHSRRNNIGRAIVEALYRIDSETQYRPDVSFVSFTKWPKGRRTPNTDPWEMIPDLAVEIINKSDRAWDVLAKVRHYFEAGVRAVWLVYPSLEVVHVFGSFASIRVLTRAEDLDGGDLIPDFRLPLADLFEGEAEEEATGPAE